MKKEISKISSERTVVMSNHLMHLTTKLKNREMRFINIIISQIDDIRDTEFLTYQFRADDFINMMGLETTHQKYDIIEDILLKLRSKSFTIPKHLSRDKKIKTVTGWLSVGHIYTDKNLIECQIDNNLTPFFLALKEHFSKYYIEEILSIRLDYSCYFFWWIIEKKYKANKSGHWFVRMRLYDIRNHLGHIKFRTKRDEKAEIGKIIKYPDWKDFKSRVLQPAIVEISEKSNYIIGWEAIKKNRKVDEIILHITPKENKIQFKKIDYQNKVKNITAIEYHKKQDLKYKKLESLLEKSTVEVKQLFKQVENGILEKNKLMTDKTKIAISRRQALDAIEDVLFITR